MFIEVKMTAFFHIYEEKEFDFFKSKRIALDGGICIIVGSGAARISSRGAKVF